MDGTGTRIGFVGIAVAMRCREEYAAGVATVAIAAFIFPFFFCISSQRGWRCATKPVKIYFSNQLTRHQASQSLAELISPPAAYFSPFGSSFGSVWEYFMASPKLKMKRKAWRWKMICTLIIFYDLGMNIIICPKILKILWVDEALKLQMEKNESDFWSFVFALILYSNSNKFSSLLTQF